MSTEIKTDQSAALAMVREVMEREAKAISFVADRLGDSVSSVLDLMFSQTGRVIFTGVGKMGCIGRKAAATFCSTGTPAVFLHAGEAAHGDLGIVAGDDIVVALSASGQTDELLNLLPYMHRFGIPIVCITCNAESELARRSKHIIDIAVETESDSKELAPTSSTTVALAVCDALAIALARRRGFTKDQFAIFHPGGNLGRKLLLRTTELMHTGDDIPLATDQVLLRDAIIVMSQKRLGAVIVIGASNELLGVLTDGDIRRLLQQRNNPLADRIGDRMTRNPVSITHDSLAADAMRLMQHREITVLPVVDSDMNVCGVLHLHDLIKAGLV